jgi:hypothetical protein
MMLVGFPNNKRISQEMVPVSRNPETTTYNTAIVAMPGLANPDKASAGVRMPVTIKTPSAPNKIEVVGKRLLASSNKEQTNTSVTAISSINIKIS